MYEIQRWQGELGNKQTGLEHDSSDWTGRFYSGWLQTKPAAQRYSDALRTATGLPATVSDAVPVLNMKETRDLLARVLFVYQGSLSRTCVAALLPNGIVYNPEDPQSTLMTNDLLKVAHDGASSLMTRVFYWVM